MLRQRMPSDRSLSHGFSRTRYRDSREHDVILELTSTSQTASGNFSESFLAISKPLGMEKKRKITDLIPQFDWTWPIPWVLSELSLLIAAVPTSSTWVYHTATAKANPPTHLPILFPDPVVAAAVAVNHSCDRFRSMEKVVVFELHRPILRQSYLFDYRRDRSHYNS